MARKVGQFPDYIANALNDAPKGARTGNTKSLHALYSEKGHMSQYECHFALR